MKPLTTDRSVLETEGLTKRFGGLIAVDRVNFSMREGELRAIIGPNGAGKTTFFNLISGCLSPSEGRVFFKGEEITHLPADQISRRGIARTFQITSIFPNITVYENIWAAAQTKKGFLNPLVHSSRLMDIRKRVEGILEIVGLHDKSGEIASNLSHGDQRLLEIGIALGTDPHLLLLDEPTAGMSVKETRETMERVKELSCKLSIIIVEHDMSVVMELADTISVFDFGRIIAEGPPEEIKRDERVQEVYLGGRSNDSEGRRHSHLLR
ncbi:MAG: ABC transporter ATP-binding protein [candidate division NC10 bacterium]|nr:ABC transporter ATP-binding protein [candidate division NC10 bacterium]